MKMSDLCASPGSELKQVTKPKGNIAGLRHHWAGEYPQPFSWEALGPRPAGVTRDSRGGGGHSSGDFRSHQFQGGLHLHQLSSWLSPASAEAYKSTAALSFLFPPAVQPYIGHDVLWIQQKLSSNTERNHWKWRQVYNHLKKQWPQPFMAFKLALVFSPGRKFPT